MASCDPYFNDVALLLHFDGTNGSTTYTDSSSYANVLTTQGTAALATAASKFGPTGLNLPGTTMRTSYVTMPVTGSSAQDINSTTADWTIEFWAQLTGGIASAYIFNYKVNPTDQFYFYINATSAFWEIYWDGGTATLPFSFVVGAWHAFALVRHNGIITLYIDGVAQSATLNTGSTTFSSTALWLGALQQSSGSIASNYTDEFRVTQGVARYTSNYTPSGPFPAINCTQTVPNLLGQTYAAALAANAAAGYVTTVQESNHPTIPSGLVISQNPPAGTASILGTNVILTFSTGPVTTVQMGGDVWGSTGGGNISSQAPEPLGQALSYAQQQANAVAFTNQSVLAALATGTSITENTPAASVPTSPAMG